MPQTQEVDRFTFDSEDVPPQATTDAEGRFELSDLAAGVATLAVKAAGFADLALPGLEIAATGVPIDLGTFVLERGITLEGKVVDPDNHPLAGAELGIHRRDLMTSSARWSALARNVKVTTDGEGRFRVEAVPSAAVLEIWAHHPGFQPQNLSGVRPALESPLTITLEPAAAVTFRVVDGAGAPVAGADVQLVRTTPGNEMSTSSRTDEQGVPHFQPLSPGEVTVSARGDAGVAPPRQIRITVGSEPVEIRLELSPAARLTGTVLGEDGEPIARVGVMARRLDSGTPPDSAMAPFAHVLSRSDGRFALPGLESGRWQIKAFRQGIEAAAIELSLGPGEQREVELVLRGHAAKLEGRVIGRVLDSAGVPVAGTVVTLLAQPDKRQVDAAPSGADGRFELQAPLRASFEVFARHPSAGSAHSEPFELALGEERVLELVLGLGNVVEGELLGLSLAQLASVQVVASRGALRLGAIVRHDGSYRFEDLPAGEWLLIADTPLTQYVHPEPIVFTGEGEVVAVDLPIGAPALLRGTVWVAGRPAEGVSIAAVCSALGSTASAASRHDGSFALELPAALCELRVHDPKTSLSVKAPVDLGAPGRLPSVQLSAVDPTTGVELRVEVAP